MNLVKSLSLVLGVCLTFSAGAHADELQFQPFIGKFRASPCPEFPRGALVDVKYDDSIMTRYDDLEDHGKWVEGLIVTSEWRPFPGYDGTPIRHQRIYHIHGLNKTGGYYKTFFDISPSKLFFKITEELRRGEKAIVRSHIEMNKKNDDQMSFTNFRAPGNSSARSCNLIKIDEKDFERELTAIGKATSSDNF